jgi:Cap4 SAVED domain
MVATATAYSEVIAKVVAELKHVLNADFLKDERETILTLREPQHLLPTTLEAAFSRNSPIDDLIDSLCIPILVGYDSSVLGSGYSEDYKEKLVKEVAATYEALKPQLPAALKQVKVQIFLIPVECVKTLSQQFSDLIGAA